MARESTEAGRRHAIGGEHEKSGTRALSIPSFLEELGRRAARSDCTILITGETGVGKGRLAKWLHQVSRRRQAPFVPVNCGAIPETIVDSQLFGHARGAFSGATSDHLGLVRAADRGTLFLDEVGELPNGTQTRLLRLLQDREVQPVGYPRPLLVDVRIIAATNGDLQKATERKRFREDLLFRLDVVRIHVKPLRERIDELEDLLTTFNLEFSELYRQRPLRFGAEAVELLKAHPWPGNIRQLRTVVERLHVLCPEEPVTTERLIDIGHLQEITPEVRSLEAVRHTELKRVLRDMGGSVARTAEAFGVHRSTIYRWLNQQDSDGLDEVAPRSAGRSHG